MHGRSRMAIDPCILTMSGRSTSDFHLRGRHCKTLLAPSVKRLEVLDESHEGLAASCYELVFRRTGEVLMLCMAVVV